MTLVTKVVSDSNVKNTNVTFTTPSQRAVNGSQANSTSSVANKVTSQAASQTANSQIKNTSSQATSMHLLVLTVQKLLTVHQHNQQLLNLPLLIMLNL